MNSRVKENGLHTHRFNLWFNDTEFTMAAEAGKGDAPRKMQDQEAYSENYDKIFGTNSWLERKKEQELLDKQIKDLGSTLYEHL
jgi:hypothetical protein